MKNTSIQWTHSTINPTSGCDGCELYRRPPAHLTTVEQFKEWLKQQPCYAAQVHELRWAKSLAITHPHLYAKHFYELRTIPGRMAEAAAWGPVNDKERVAKPWITSRRRHIFISDMSDALSRDVPFEFLKAEIIDNVASDKGRRHVWQWLSKRPERMAEFDAWLAEQGIAWPGNLWAGTSVTTQRTADVRVPSLLEVRARVRFLSCEPLFGPVTLDWFGVRDNLCEQIHWVIVGGASGYNAKPFDVAWARSLIAQCRGAGVACFVKQLGANPISNVGWTGPLECIRDSHGGEWSEWPADLRVRELPRS